MEFELISITGVNAPRLSEDGTQMEMYANCKIGVVGMPNEEKYSQFFAEFTLFYVWDLTVTTADALAGLQTFGEDYVSNNYPTI
jgi:hypothetical protein